MSELTNDQMKLLYLISKKSGIREDNGNIIWVKETALLTLVFEGIRKGIFHDYDYAPSLVNFHGVKLYANVSQEYLKDIDYLIQQKLINKLKLNTKYYDNINAYSVTPKFYEENRDSIPTHIKEKIDTMMQCAICRSNITVRIKERNAHLVCTNCGTIMDTEFFKLENIQYHSVAYFSGGGR